MFNFYVFSISISLLITFQLSLSNSNTCKLCEGLISDCSCDFQSVDDSVSLFFSPLLKKITEDFSFFRLFKIDMERKCPFWGKYQH